MAGLFDDIPAGPAPTTGGLFDDIPSAPAANGGMFADLPEADDTKPPLATMEQWDKYNHHGGDFGGALARGILEPLKLPGTIIKAVQAKDQAKPGPSMDPISGVTSDARPSHHLADLADYINQKISAAQDWFDPLPPGHVPWYKNIPSALGSAGAFMLSGAMGKAAGAGDFAPTLALGVATGANQQYEDAVANGADPDQALISIAAGGALGATDALPMTYFMNRINKLTGGRLAGEIRKQGLDAMNPSRLAELVKGFLFEGTQEGLQQVGQNWVAKDLAGYDPARTLSENMWDNFLTGGVVGSLIGGGTATLQRMETAHARKQLEDIHAELMQDPINQIAGSFTPVADLVKLGGIREEISAILAERGRAATAEKEAKFGKPFNPKDAMTNVYLQKLEPRLGPGIDTASRKLGLVSSPERSPQWMDFKDQPVHTQIETGLPKREDGSPLSVQEALAKQPVVAVSNQSFERELRTLQDWIKRDEEYLKNYQASPGSQQATLPEAMKKRIARYKENIIAVKTKQKIATTLLRDFKSYVGALREAFAIPDKFVVTGTEDTSGTSWVGDRRYGYLAPAGMVPGIGKVSTIYANLEDMSQKIFEANQDPHRIQSIKRHLFESITHEMGHILFDNVFTDLLEKASNGTPEEAQKAYELYNYIEEGYRRWLKDAVDNGSMGFLAMSKFGLEKGLDWMEQGRAIDKPVREKDSDTRRYLFMLDEFFADMTARLATQGQLPNAALTEVFRPLMEGYKNAFESFPEFAKNQYGGSWLEYLKSMRLDVVIENARAAAAAGGGKDIIDALRGKVPGYDPAKFAGLRDYLDRFNKGMSYGLNLLQIVNENPHIPALQFYLRGIEAWQNYQRDMASRSTDALRSWKNLGKKEAAEVSQVFLEEQDLRRRMTPAELSAKLTAEGIEVYTQVRAVFDYILDEMKSFAIDDANKTYEQGSELQKSEVERIAKEFDQMKAKGYFPSIRFGKYTITARAKTDLVYQGQEYKEGQLITFPVFETQKERNRALEVLRRELGDRANISPSVMRESEFAIQGLPRSMIRALRNKLKLQGNLTPDMEKAFEQELQNLAPFRNFRKQFLRKRGIHGASEDMIRSFAYYTRSAGGHIARAKFSDEMLAAIKGLQEDTEVIKRYGGLAQNRQEMVHWLQRHFDYIMNPANELAALRGVGFVAYLGFSVKSAFVNLMQVPMVTYPYLAARYGDIATTKSLGEASVTLKDWFAHKNDFLDALPDSEGKIKKPNEAKAGVAKMLTQLMSEGVIDQSLATELAIAASENNLDRGLHLPKGQRIWHEFSRYSALGFHLVEKVNRYTTAIATYNLEYKASGDHAAAVERAKQAVRSTQYENARWNRPEIFRGKKSVFFLFGNFLQNTLYFAVRDPGARRWWMMMLLLAGFMGLPGAEDMEDLVDFLATQTNKALGAKNPKFQLRVELREALEELHVNPDLIMHGLSQDTFGLGQVGELTGIPIPRLDLSGSIGMGNIIPGTGIPTAIAQGDPNQAAVQGLGEVAGAGGNLVEQYYAALLSRDPDSWKRLEKLLPMMAMRNVSKATRYFVRGEEQTAGGASIAKFDAHDMRDQLEIFAQGLGFMPRKLALGWEREIAARDAVQYYQVHAQALQRQLNWAFFQEDREAIADVRAAIGEFNSTVPYPEMKMGPTQIRNSIRNYIISRKIAGMGESGERKYRRLMKQVEQAYPDPYGDMIRSDPLAQPD